MAENDLPAAFLSALPQIVRLHAPCPCSHAGRIYMQKTGISQDFANAMPRPCSVSPVALPGCTPSLCGPQGDPAFAHVVNFSGS